MGTGGERNKMKLILLLISLPIWFIAYELHRTRTEEIEYMKTQTSFIYQRLEAHRNLLNGMRERIISDENYVNETADMVYEMKGIRPKQFIRRKILR